MIDLNKGIKLFDILNSEGTILGLYSDTKGNLFLSSFLKDDVGTIYYSVEISDLKNYIQSKLALKELYGLSKSFLIKHKSRDDIKTYLKEDFVESLQCGNDYYKDIPESMKSVKSQEYFGLK